MRKYYKKKLLNKKSCTSIEKFLIIKQTLINLQKVLSEKVLAFLVLSSLIDPSHPIKATRANLFLKQKQNGKLIIFVSATFYQREIIK